MPPYIVPEPPCPAYQNVGEIMSLWNLVASKPHARVLEIGSLFGGTLWYWSHLPEIKTLVTIDLPTPWPRLHDQVIEARTHWQEWFSQPESFCDIQGNSSDPDTVELARGWGPFDFAFIDGGHLYDEVKSDWLLYSPLVRPGGTVAFHDTWPNWDRHEPGVVKWVDELRHHLPSIEWTDPDGVGICAFTLPG